MKKKLLSKKIELLAPAGGPLQYRAAVNAGADAVYIGGSMFNARIGAGNFNLSEMEEAVDYGHLRGVKTYVTMNTLMSDSDVSKGVEYATKLYLMGVDALIIQDPGLGLAIHESIPDFELHLSTQATVYNPGGVYAASKLGYKRVVLARECSLDEIKSCADRDSITRLIGNKNCFEDKSVVCEAACDKSLSDKSNGEAQSILSEISNRNYSHAFETYEDLTWPEIEVFVHGALCMCYSGQCQLSRFIGGRSGNKGMCAQPCRLPYKHYDIYGHKIPEQYPLSPKDLCMIDNLGELIDMGVSSLKIEGRMKSAEYVACVISIYRKYIDAYYRDGRYNVTEEDRNKLKQIFNRGGFTEGYAHEDPEEHLMSGMSPKNQGLYMGKVSRVYKNSPYIEIETDDDSGAAPEMQDVVEIRADYGENAGVHITFLQNTGSGRYKIGDIKDKVAAGDPVYRIVSQRLKNEVSEIIEHERKGEISLTFTAFADKPLKLTAKNSTGISVSCELEGILAEQARSKGTSEDDIKRQLSKAGSTPFEVKGIRIIMDEGLFIPVSQINELRRRALEALKTKTIASFKRSREEISGKDEYSGENSFTHGDRKDGEDKAKGCNIKSGIDTEAIIDDSCDLRALINDGRTVMLPSATKGKYDAWIIDVSSAIEQKLSSSGGTVVVNNISQFTYLDGDKVKLIGGRGLNITNHKTVEAYRHLGMSDEYLISAELLDKAEMEDVPLMITEHRMQSGRLVDRKGAEYAVEYNEDMHKTFIFPLKNK